MWAALVPILKTVLGLGLPSLQSIIVDLQKEKTKQLDSKTEQERIASEERIKKLEQQKEIAIQAEKDRKEIIQTGQAHGLGEWVRLAWALPFIVYIWKLLLWDKVLGWGVTDPLSPTLEYILWTVLGGYFLLAITKK